jgi:ABC-2 type transport system permease protein
LAGIFNPITNLPPVLLIASRIAPMTYAIDLVRSVFYSGSDVYNKVVLFNVPLDLLVIAGYSILFISIGTYLFIKNERNR